FTICAGLRDVSREITHLADAADRGCGVVALQDAGYFLSLRIQRNIIEFCHGVLLRLPLLTSGKPLVTYISTLLPQLLLHPRWFGYHPRATFSCQVPVLWHG